MAENIFGHDSEYLKNILSRRVFVPRKDPLLTYRNDITVIASVAGNPSRDFEEYASLLVQDFGRCLKRVEVLVADNTLNQGHRQDLQNMGNVLADGGISFQHLEVPTRGKVLGLNAGIERSSAPVCVFVDMNKRPVMGTLKSLSEDVAEGNVDLISARVAGTLSKRGHPTQWWNDGKAYAINSRFLPSAFPKILADDAFISGYVRGHGGRFAVAQDRLVVDTKGIHSSYEEGLRRTARQWIALFQLNYLTVYDREGKEMKPALENVHEAEIHKSFPAKIAGNIYSVAHLSSDERIAAGKKFTSRVGHILNRGDDVNTYKKEYLTRLLDEPEMCAW